MRKVHTREKRMHKLTSHLPHATELKGIKRHKRPKTFRTEEQAHAYAKEHGVSSYCIIKAKKGKRFQISPVNK